MEDFSVEMFESVINYFERTNGFQRDTMTQVFYFYWIPALYYILLI